MSLSGVRNLKVGEQVKTAPVNKNLVKVYNYFGKIEEKTELWLKSVDQVFICPDFGEFILVPEYHASNLVRRTPELLTTDYNKVVAAKARYSGEIVNAESLDNSVLDQFSEEQLQEALERLMKDKQSKNKRKVGQTENTISITDVDDLFEDVIEKELEDGN